MLGCVLALAAASAVGEAAAAPEHAATATAPTSTDPRATEPSAGAPSAAQPAGSEKEPWWHEPGTPAGLLAMALAAIGLIGAWVIAKRSEKSIEKGVAQRVDALMPVLVAALRDTMAPGPAEQTGVSNPSAAGAAPAADDTSARGDPAGQSEPPAPEQAAAGPAAPSHTARAVPEQTEFVGAEDITGDGHLDFLNQSGDERAAQLTVISVESSKSGGPVSRTLRNSSGRSFFVDRTTSGTDVVTLDADPQDAGRTIVRRYAMRGGEFEELAPRPVEELSAQERKRLEGPPPWGSGGVPV